MTGQDVTLQGPVIMGRSGVSRRVRRMRRVPSDEDEPANNTPSRGTLMCSFIELSLKDPNLMP